MKSEKIRYYKKKLENFKINGLEYKEEEVNEQLKHKLVELCGNELGVDVKNSDISSCHRLPKRRNDTYSPIVLGFVARRIKQAIM